MRKELPDFMQGGEKSRTELEANQAAYYLAAVKLYDQLEMAHEPDCSFYHRRECNCCLVSAIRILERILMNVVETDHIVEDALRDTTLEQVSKGLTWSEHCRVFHLNMSVATRLQNSLDIDPIHFQWMRK